jgi:hypothetical protein
VRAAGLYTEGANAPLQFHAQADVLVAPLHARRALAFRRKTSTPRQLKPTPSAKKPPKKPQKKPKLLKTAFGRRQKKLPQWRRENRCSKSSRSESKHWKRKRQKPGPRRANKRQAKSPCSKGKTRQAAWRAAGREAQRVA